MLIQKGNRVTWIEKENNMYWEYVGTVMDEKINKEKVVIMTNYKYCSVTGVILGVKQLVKINADILKTTAIIDSFT